MLYLTLNVCTLCLNEVKKHYTICMLMGCREDIPPMNTIEQNIYALTLFLLFYMLSFDLSSFDKAELVLN